MAEITCPKCHTTFNISEEEYKSIKTQLRDQEFAAALHEREQIFEQRTQDAVKLAEAARYLPNASTFYRISTARTKTC